MGTRPREHCWVGRGGGRKQGWENCTILGRLPEGSGGPNALESHAKHLDEVIVQNATHTLLQGSWSQQAVLQLDHVTWCCFHECPKC